MVPGPGREPIKLISSLKGKIVNASYGYKGAYKYPNNNVEKAFNELKRIMKEQGITEIVIDGVKYSPEAKDGCFI